MKRLFAMLVVAACISGVRAAEKPNLVFILADDLGYGDLGCFGQQKIKTPRLDRMAKEGMKFTQFYAGATVCAPSRCVLMTGLHTGHARVRGNAGRRDPQIQMLRPSDITVAEMLKEQGYTTGLFGKWGLGDEGEAEPGMPNNQGFDRFFGYANQRHAHNYYPSYLLKDGERFPLRNVVPGEPPYGQGWATKRVDYSHDLIMEQGMNWIRESAKSGKPFFAYLPVTIPHANNEGSRGTGDGQEIPDHGIYKDKEWTEPNKGQAAMVTHLDRDVGRVLDLLKELGVAENTLVIFSSDNGHHREGGNDPEFFDANGPLRGMKRDLYEGGIRVPTIAWWPGKIKPGQVSDHVAYFGDLMALAEDLSGGSAPGNLDSVSFLPTLLGKGKQKRHKFLYWEFFERGFTQAVLMEGRWKAVRVRRLSAPWELYDLKNDLGEEHDVAAQHPAILKRILAYVKTARTDDPNWPVVDAPAPKQKKGKN